MTTRAVLLLLVLLVGLTLILDGLLRRTSSIGLDDTGYVGLSLLVAVAFLAFLVKEYVAWRRMSPEERSRKKAAERAAAKAEKERALHWVEEWLSRRKHR